MNANLLNNRYSLDSILGNGGMARVYRARDQMLERTVAIKVLREDYSSDPAFRERFRQEAKAAANLSHPNIVTVHDFGIDAGRLFIVMEYVPGTNLNALLEKRGRFTVPETITLIQQACAGIGYAHRAGLVHCDVKPHNFLITPDNRLKVTDFGIARALASIKPEEQVEFVWGSPQYFSPEQAGGKPPSPASDVYSLGVVMYFMLTGRLPFTASSAAEVARMHRYANPTRPRVLNPSLPASLEEILLKVLAKEPSQRYRTADQLGRVLRALEIQSPEAAPTTAVSSREIENTAFSGVEVQLNRDANSQQPASRVHPVQGATPSPASQPRSTSVAQSRSNLLDENPLDIDWATLGLGLLATLFVGGLIPLWVWVYFSYTQ
jgi:serine/threonine-protein kinase